MKPKFFFIITIFVAAALAFWGYRDHERMLAERCYDYVDPLRVKVGQTEFQVPQKDILYISEENKYEFARNLFDLDAHLDEVRNRSFLNGQQRFEETKPVSIYDKGNPGVVRKGICRSTNDLPVRAKHLSLQMRLDIGESGGEIGRYPTYCSESEHLTKYTPCTYAPGFFCREVMSKWFINKTMFTYAPDVKILGLPVVFSCSIPEDSRDVFSHCALWAWVGTTASLMEYTGWDFKIAVAPVADAQYLQEVKDKIAVIDTKLRSIVVSENDTHDLTCRPNQSFCKDYDDGAAECALPHPNEGAHSTTVLWKQ